MKITPNFSKKIETLEQLSEEGGASMPNKVRNQAHHLKLLW